MPGDFREPMTQVQEEMYAAGIDPAMQYMQQQMEGRTIPRTSPDVVGSRAFPTALARAADRTQGPEQASYSPFTRTEKQPDQVGDPYFDPRKAAEAMIQSGDTQLMMAGYKLLSDPLAGAEYGTTPFIADDGTAYLVNKAGGLMPTGLKGKPDKSSTSSLGQLISERNALPPGHPSIAMYDEAIRKAATHAPAAQMNNYGSPVAGIGPDGNPVFFQPSRTGSAPSIVEGVTPPPPKPVPPTEAENTASGFLGRMQAAERIIGQLDGGELTLGTSIVGGVPFVGDFAQRKVMNEKQQQYKQAADDWIRAKLRKESGAVIGESEREEEYKTYFPQPGDKPATIQQKAMARRQAEQQLIQSAGRAAPQLTEAEFTQPEIDYIAKRRALGIPDQQIAYELQKGFAGKKAGNANKLSPAEQKELEQLRKRFGK